MKAREKMTILGKQMDGAVKGNEKLLFGIILHYGIFWFCTLRVARRHIDAYLERKCHLCRWLDCEWPPKWEKGEGGRSRGERDSH